MMRSPTMLLLLLLLLLLLVNNSPVYATSIEARDRERFLRQQQQRRQRQGGDSKSQRHLESRKRVMSRLRQDDNEATTMTLASVFQTQWHTMKNALLDTIRVPTCGYYNNNDNNNDDDKSFVQDGQHAQVCGYMYLFLRRYVSFTEIYRPFTRVCGFFHDGIFLEGQRDNDNDDNNNHVCGYHDTKGQFHGEIVVGEEVCGYFEEEYATSFIVTSPTFASVCGTFDAHGSFTKHYAPFERVCGVGHFDELIDKEDKLLLHSSDNVCGYYDAFGTFQPLQDVSFQDACGFYKNHGHGTRLFVHDERIPKVCGFMDETGFFVPEWNNNNNLVYHDNYNEAMHKHYDKNTPRPDATSTTCSIKLTRVLEQQQDETEDDTSEYDLKYLRRVVQWARLLIDNNNDDTISVDSKTPPKWQTTTEQNVQLLTVHFEMRRGEPMSAYAVEEVFWRLRQSSFTLGLQAVELDCGDDGPVRFELQ